jgi:hypothetical protein
MLPRIKITDLLIEVDEWTSFTAHFTHLRNGEVVSDRALLLSAILADGINLGITRMAEACPGISASVLSRIATWHIREETYTKALLGGRRGISRRSTPALEGRFIAYNTAGMRAT